MTPPPATLGVPKPLIGVRFFDTTARYAANDVVVQAGSLYQANATIPPGAFNGANWTQLGVVTTMPAGSVVFTPTGNVIAIDVQSAIAEVDAEKVAKAGDTMAGHLSLPTAPNAANAVRKDYVDAADAALATLAGSKVATRRRHHDRAAGAARRSDDGAAVGDQAVRRRQHRIEPRCCLRHAAGRRPRMVRCGGRATADCSTSTTTTATPRSG